VPTPEGPGERDLARDLAQPQYNRINVSTTNNINACVEIKNNEKYM